MLKKRILIIISYILASIWGFIILDGLIVNPYDVTGINMFVEVWLVIGVSTVMLGPLGLVYAVDRHLKNKENKNEILKR